MSRHPEVETDPRLLEVSDSQVLLNFASALDALYPLLRTVHADRYDPYDDVVEPLFWGMVFSTFAGKYGVAVPKKSCVGYEMSVPDFTVLHHVRVRPREHARARIGGEWTKYEAIDELAFVGFDDGQLWLSGHESEGDPEFGGFDLVRVEPLDSTGVPVGQGSWLWFQRNEVDYEFVRAES